MKLFFALGAFCIMFFFTACKKCSICACTINGIVTERENCAIGGGSSNKTLATWEKAQKELYGCEEVICWDK
jgi:hypothetical protein